MTKTKLKRSLSLPLLIFYGLGTILGAGIYALIGKVAGSSGLFTPLAFIIAAILASFTALSYAELSARFPKSASEVAYVNHALKRKTISIIVGLLVVFAGIVSIAALSIGFSGYLKEFFQIPEYTSISILIIGFSLIAIWGIKESVIIAGIITIIEITGLLIIIAIGGDSLLTLPQNFTSLIPAFTIENWTGIFLGAFLAFFAFIGFESMVNVAEETKNPKKTLPLAIIISIIIVTILYILISLIATLSVPISELAESDAPLSLVIKQKSNFFPQVINIISLIAISNGILIQIIMSSRILYGMGEQKLIPLIFSSINSRTRTPVFSTIIISSIALILSLYFHIENLANTTSFIILCVFVLVNLSLWIIKIRDPIQKDAPNYPLFIPIAGFFLSLSCLILKLLTL